MIRTFTDKEQILKSTLTKNRQALEFTGKQVLKRNHTLTIRAIKAEKKSFTKRKQMSFSTFRVKNKKFFLSLANALKCLSLKLARDFRFLETQQKSALAPTSRMTFIM